MVFIRTYVCAHVFICTCIYVYHMYVCTYERMYAYVCMVCAYVRTYVRIHMYTYTYMYVYVGMYV